MNIREVCLLSLIDTEKGAYTNLVLKKRLADFDSRDKNLATNIVYGVLRHKTKIDTTIASKSKIKLNKLERHVLNILRLSIYQIIFLDKIPKEAAVFEGVNLAKKYAYKSSGFVNAILRNVKNEVFNDLTIEYSHPQWMIDMWTKDYGQEKTLEILKANNEIADISFRDEEIQGLSSQKAIEILGPKPNETIIDVCAAPGGKSLYMAEKMNNRGEIISCDIHPHRVELIAKNANRKGFSIIHPTLQDGRLLNKDWLHSADKVLVDAPCSGLGLIHKKPDIKWTKSLEDIKNLSNLQREILEVSSNYVKPSGKLMYCTCTINKLENNNIIANFLKDHKNFKLVYEEQIFPSKEYDGFYIALFILS